MLHLYREAARTKISLARAKGESISSHEMLSLLSGLRSWLELEPAVYGAKQGRAVYVIYHGAAFLADELLDLFGRQMAAIQKQWPVCVYGTAENQETIRLAAWEEDGCIQMVQYSISGEPADALQTLCLQIDCGDHRTAEELCALLQGMNWRSNAAAMPWQAAEFLRQQRLLSEQSNGTLFCYGGVDRWVTAEGCLMALDFSKKTALWSAYLKDGLEPMEFEWLAARLRDGELAYRMEWELALQEALDQLGFRIVQREKAFEIFDGEGRRRYFGADERRAAAWALLKILFPLNYQ